MDDAGAGVHGDVVGEHAENFAIEEGMLEVEALELASGKVSEFARIGQAALLGGVFRELRGDDINLAARFQGHVFFIGMESDGHGRGQRPGSCGPDDGEKFFAGQRGIELRRIVEQSIFHPDGRAGVVFVFDFGFGERRFVVHAPVDRAQAFVDESVFEKREKSPEHHRLVGGVMVA